MRSKSWTRRLWKCPQLVLVLLIGAVLLCNVDLVASQDGIPEDGVDTTADPIAEGVLDNAKDAEDAKQVEDVKDVKDVKDSKDVEDAKDAKDVADLSPTGKCSAEIKKFCTVKSVHNMDCIAKKLKSDDGKGEISEACQQEYRDLKVAFYRDLTLDKKIQDACEKDIQENCPAVNPGGVLACLRDAKDELSQSCQDEIFVAEQDAVDDYRMDSLLAQMCHDDVQNLCKDVKSGEGRIQGCLRSHSDKITYNCKEQLFRQERQNADDLRLNPELFKECVNDQQKFCPNLSPGKARVKDCLESHRLDPGFSAPCKSEFDKMLARRSADFRLNPTLKEKCEQDIKMSCESQLLDMSEVPDGDPKVIHCLQDFRDNLRSEECKTEVHKLLALAAEDYRFDKEFADACEEYKQKFCRDTENDKVLSCLQTKREQLDSKCRAAVFSMEWRLSGDIDYKFAMKQGCVVETEKFCHGLRHDRGAIIECLQGKVDDSEMGADCKKEIVADQVESAKDFRLNYRIYKNCKQDVKSLCNVPEKCKGPEPCGGVVLQCLQEKIEQLSSEDCKKDVISFEIKETKNEDLNVPLQTACKGDLTKFCPKRRSQDHSRALACLRRNRDSLSKSCKDEELRFSMMEASDIRLTPSLMNACGAELISICPHVSSTNGEAFKCLQLNLESINMGVACKIEVDLQGARQASDYRLDVRVRTECKDDVNKFCGGVSKAADGHALVLKCFVDQFRNLTGGCQTEVAYAVRMALWQYQFDSNLTSPCDGDVRKSCDANSVKPIDGVVIGTFGQCLSSQGRRGLHPDCRPLVRVATKDGAFLNGTIRDADMADALAKYKELMGGDGLGRSGVGLFWVTTVVAFVAILAVALFRRYSGPPKTYTLVVKGGDL